MVSAGAVCSAIICAGERAQLVLLHLGVLELAQAVLQRLQLLDRLPVLARVVQGAEDLQQVAQLLAALAQVVQGLGGGRRGDGAAVGEHPAVRPARSAGRRACGGGRARRLAGSSLLEVLAASRRDSRENLAERSPRASCRCAAARCRARCCLERPQLRSVRRRPGRPPCRRYPSRYTSRSRVGVVRSPSHLNSGRNRAARPAGSTSPASFSADLVRRTATRRSCRNSVSMSRIVPGTLASRVSSSQVSTVADGGRGGLLRLEPDTRSCWCSRRGGVRPRPAPAPAGRMPASVTPSAAASSSASLSAWEQIAAQRGDDQPGRQARRLGRGGHLVDRDAGDGLVVVVEHAELAGGADGAGHRQQGADPDDGGQLLAQRALGQGADQPGLLGGAGGAGAGRGGGAAWSGRGGGLGRDELAVAAGQPVLGGPARAAGELEGQAGPVQPPVEGVQPGAADRARPPVGLPAEPRPDRDQAGQRDAIAGRAQRGAVKDEFTQRISQKWPHDGTAAVCRGLEKDIGPHLDR